MQCDEEAEIGDTGSSSHLDEGIGLETFGVFHGDFEAIAGGEAGGVILEVNGLQDVGQIADIIQTAGEYVLLVLHLRLRQGHGEELPC